VLSVSAHLTDRDRELTRLVGRHRVLTTDQLTALRFSNLTTARHRLSVLVRLGVLRRFRPRREPGSAPWHYVLGPVGAAMLGQEDRDEKKWLPQVRADRQLALERSQRLGHMTGASWFFVALARHTRENGGELVKWLNEAETVLSFDDLTGWADIRSRFPHPDGAGTWAGGDRQVRFLLEYDTGSESLPALTGKLDATRPWPRRRRPGTTRRARSCCSASFLCAASSLPVVRSLLPGRPRHCGSRRRRSTRA